MKTTKSRVWDGQKMNYGNSSCLISLDGKRIMINGFDQTEELEKGKLVIMNSTGVFDKNGKEIYEGDIVINKAEPCPTCGQTIIRKSEVKWNNSSWQLSGVDLTYNITTCTPKGSIPDQYNYLEVIGNVYEDIEKLT